MQHPDHPAAPSLKAAYEAWLAAAGERSRSQPAVEELMAEHHLMGSILLSMEAELRRMQGGRSLRPRFWADVVDFNGNFVHLCHRVKEEAHLLPAIVESRLVPEGTLQQVHQEHGKAKDLTLGIRDGVEQGDWEKVLRLVVLYVHSLQGHMRKEEDGLFRVALRGLPGEVDTRLRAAFDRVDAEALGSAGRAHYVDLARRMAAGTGVEYDLAPST